MTRKRDHISLETKLASALFLLGHVPYEHAQQMTAAQFNSLYAFDHNKLHSQDGSDHFANLAPLGILAHRKKTATIDVPQAAKTKRLAKAQAALSHFLTTGEKPPLIGRPKRKIPSRPFQQGHRPLRSRSSFQQRRAAP